PQARRPAAGGPRQGRGRCDAGPGPAHRRRRSRGRTGGRGRHRAGGQRGGGGHGLGRAGRTVTTGPTYLVLRADEVAYGDPGPIAPDSTGLSRWSGVERARGALHTGVALCRLEPGGRVPGHVHSFEESCYVLEGEVVLQTPDGAVQLTAGDYGVLPVGVP